MVNPPKDETVRIRKDETLHGWSRQAPPSSIAGGVSSTSPTMVDGGELRCPPWPVGGRSAALHGRSGGAPRCLVRPAGVPPLPSRRVPIPRRVAAAAAVAGQRRCPSWGPR
ncbi:unnamed protein product [Urochloa humidicola]